MDKKNFDLSDIEIDEKVASFRHKKIGDQYLITNDFGYFSFLDPEDFKNYLKGGLDENSDLYKKLEDKGFIKNLEKIDDLTQRYVKRHSSLQRGPGLHIVVVTLRCNYNCIYCQASSKGMDKKGLDMDKDTARKVVDRIFETENDNINIEFQGGEPLVNWEVVKFIVNYGREKEEKTDKDLSFSLVSNLSLLDKKRLDFLVEKSVDLCTSLDGPEGLHNKNRPFPGGNSYKETIEGLKLYREKQKEVRKKHENIPQINALSTISRFSLNHPKKIVDEYLKRNFHGLHLRPLSYLGASGGEAKGEIGYTAEEFIDFWKQSMDYILEVNKRGRSFYERGSRIMLTKILTDRDPGFTDLASPCGAVIGQVLYNYDGSIYTCDEGRMVDDETFKLGNVDDTSYEEMVTSDTCKTMLNASTLENQSCDMCAYKPYCGVCPVKNYALEDTLFPQMPNTDWCKIKKTQLDYLFAKLRKEDNLEVFKRWVKKA